MKLPIVSGEQVIKLLQKDGFSVTRQKGSHISLHKKLEDGTTVLVVVPRKSEIKKGTLLSIIKQSGMNRDDFISKVK
ncbi:MAG TPA: type II toxin-antitoxin system HicA family toxin [Candidatus Nanoarchaeia archaeon]|nr:type II toxin-antitoxin system HicA family toxin [Candidatus Nanoarchaeia archaeon]